MISLRSKLNDRHYDYSVRYESVYRKSLRTYISLSQNSDTTASFCVSLI